MYNADGDGDRLFSRGNPRRFEMWAVDSRVEANGSVVPDVPASNADGSSFDGWTKLIANAEQIKPSGLPLGEETPQDREVGEQGINFDSDFQVDPLPTVQFVRFIVLETWQGGPPNWVYLGEVEFFGQVVE